MRHMVRLWLPYRSLICSMAGGYGLDDSDFDEFLESDSSLEAVATSLVPAKLPQLHKAVTATVWRGPVENCSGDACRSVPASRSGRLCLPPLIKAVFL